MRKIKFFLFYLLSAFAKPSRGASERLQAKEEDILKIKVSDRSEEKKKAYEEWSKAENIAVRLVEYEKAAAAALALGLKFREECGIPPDPPLPPLEYLTPEMRRQQPSMIRIMLKAQGWKYDWDNKEWRVR